MDKHFYKTAFVILITVGLGAFKALKREIEWNKHHYQGIFTLVTGNIFVILFMYIQKRVHKEVFLEMKQKVSLQDEFKTIFNQLDEAIFITIDSKITKINTTFQKFLLNYLDYEVMKDVSKVNDLYE